VAIEGRRACSLLEIVLGERVPAAHVDVRAQHGARERGEVRRTRDSGTRRREKEERERPRDYSVP
jgi:hypothetical protein